VISTYADDTGGVVEAAPQAVGTAFDEGLALFRAGEYAQAQPYFDTAVTQMSGDAVAHEVRALNLFALGQYQAAAATLNSLLTSAPGMDWTTMSGLYGNVNDYSVQLRALEAYCQAHPQEAAPYFVLAYHYLVTGYPQEAADALKTVVALQPQDATARRMLEALQNPQSPGTPVSPGTPATPASPDDLTLPDVPLPAPADDAATPDLPEINLTGTWKAQAADTTIDLVVTEDSQFTWTAHPAGQPPIQVAGTMTGTSDSLELESPEQGAMAGRVTPLDADSWRFNLNGAPANDPGLVFKRQP
jgi:tetratricopeptide (TPR) repeat protein